MFSLLRKKLGAVIWAVFTRVVIIWNNLFKHHSITLYNAVYTVTFCKPIQDAELIVLVKQNKEDEVEHDQIQLH